MEFEKGHNPEVVERPTDNEEIPTVRQVFTNAQPRVHSDKMVRKFSKLLSNLHSQKILNQVLEIHILELEYGTAPMLALMSGIHK